MKKFCFILICTFLYLSASGCGNLSEISRYVLLNETPAPSIPFIYPDSDESIYSDTGSSSSVAALYDSCSYFIPALTAKEQTIFFALYEGIMAFQETIPIPVSASAEEIKDLMHFLCNECPELLHLDSSWTQRSNLLGNVTAVIPAYTMNQETYDLQKNQIETLLAQFHTQLAGADQYQIELTLFDHIINNCWYTLDAENCQNAYGALISGGAKCDGRAKALVWGLRSFGIKASVITGSNHAWVIAQIGGYHYNVDPTYDDNETGGVQQPCSYTHFNVPESSIISDPYPADELFIRRGYPSAVRWDHNYHIRSGLWISAGQSAEAAFLEQLQNASAAKEGCINLRFESAADYAAAKEASQGWIQDFIDARGLRCSITTYDFSTLNTLFLKLTF